MSTVNASNIAVCTHSINNNIAHDGKDTAGNGDTDPCCHPQHAENQGQHLHSVTGARYYKFLEFIHDLKFHKPTADEGPTVRTLLHCIQQCSTIFERIPCFSYCLYCATEVEQQMWSITPDRLVHMINVAHLTLPEMPAVPGLPSWSHQMPPWYGCSDDDIDQFKQSVVFGLQDNEYGLHAESITLDADAMERLEFSADVVFQIRHGLRLDFATPPPPFRLPRGHYAHTLQRIDELRPMVLAQVTPRGVAALEYPLSYVPRTCNPMIAVDRVMPDGSIKTRPCFDFTVSGVNEGIVKFTVLLPTVDDLVARLGPGFYIAVHDMTACFLHFALHQSSRRHCGVEDLAGRGFGYQTTLIFGNTNGVHYAQCFLEAVVARCQRGIVVPGTDEFIAFSPVAYVDDIAYTAPDRETLSKQVKAFKHLCATIKADLADEKDKEGQEVIYLGTCFSSIGQGRLSYTSERVSAAQQMCGECVDDPDSVTLGQFAKLVGKLNHIAPLVPGAACRLPSLFKCMYPDDDESDSCIRFVEHNNDDILDEDQWTAPYQSGQWRRFEMDMSGHESGASVAAEEDLVKPMSAAAVHAMVASTRAWNPHQHVSIEAALDDLRWWIDLDYGRVGVDLHLLRSPKGRWTAPTALDELDVTLDRTCCTSSGTVVITTDAACDAQRQCGGYYVRGLECQVTWQSSVDDRSINYFELATIVHAVQVLGKMIKTVSDDPRILIRTDSAVCVAIVNRGFSPSRSLNRLAMILHDHCAAEGIDIAARYINTLLNSRADLISRGATPASDIFILTQEAESELEDKLLDCFVDGLPAGLLRTTEAAAARVLAFPGWQSTTLRGCTLITPPFAQVDQALDMIMSQPPSAFGVSAVIVVPVGGEWDQRKFQRTLRKSAYATPLHSWPAGAKILMALDSTYRDHHEDVIPTLLPLHIQGSRFALQAWHFRVSSTSSSSNVSVNGTLQENL